MQIGQKINDDVEILIRGLERDFCEASLQSKLQNSVDFIRHHYFEPIQSFINALEAAIVENPKAVKCWDRNKKNFLSAAITDVESALSDDAATLDSQIQELVKQVNEAVLKIDSDVKQQCGSQAVCIVNYVS